MMCLLLAVTIGIFAESGELVSEREYAPECDLVPKYVEGPGPFVNVTEGYFDDPYDVSKDYRVLLLDQVYALPPGTYRVAVSFGDEYGPLSSPFTRTQPPQTSGCWDGPTFYSTGTIRTWQWEPKQVKANMTALGPAWVDWRTTKANKKWQWMEARCAG